MKWNRQVRATLSILLGIGAVFFLVLSLRTALARGEIVHWPSFGRVVAALTVLALGMWLASTAWVAILGEGSAGNRTDFLTAQLAKYIPGGVWQPLSQVGLSATRSISGKSTGSAILVYATAQVGAGLLLLPLLATAPTAPSWAKTGGIGFGVVGVIMILAGGRVADRLRGGGSREFWSLVGSQARTATNLGVVALLAANMAAQGAAFWLLVGEQLGFASMGAYSAAWIGGFLAIPFPAGLGIREAILVTLLPIGAGQVITVSLLQRLIAAVSEVSLIFVSRLLR